LNAYSLRDLYQNVGIYNTTERTITDVDEKRHYITGPEPVNDPETAAKTSPLLMALVVMALILWLLHL